MAPNPRPFLDRSRPCGATSRTWWAARLAIRPRGWQRSVFAVSPDKQSTVTKVGGQAGRHDSCAGESAGDTRQPVFDAKHREFIESSFFFLFFFLLDPHADRINRVVWNLLDSADFYSAAFSGLFDVIQCDIFWKFVRFSIVNLGHLWEINFNLISEIRG